LLKEVTMTKTRLWSTVGAAGMAVVLAAALSASAFPLGAATAEKAGPPRKSVHKQNAVYPQEAKDKKIEGSVVVDVLIAADGTVKEAKATRGPRELYDSAVAAVREWRFEKGPSDTRASLTIRYSLDK
jgi:TonB family protein